MNDMIQRHVLVEKLFVNFPKIKEELRTNTGKYDTFDKARDYILEYCKSHLADTDAMDVGNIAKEGH